MGNSKSKIKSVSSTVESLIVKNSEIDLTEYFSLINQRAQRYKQENLSNKFNISISLDKKDFNAPFAIKKYSIIEEKNYIYWKDYIRSYLFKQTKKGFDWAIDVLE